jgi:geranylgeranyl pyrophosphate synthase
MRNKAIDALNAWYNVPPHEISIILRIIDLLHGASLMLDDIQDASQLRRGKPAAHVVFGPMQTINSAGYRFLAALSEVRKLAPRCMDIFCGTVARRSAFCGIPVRGRKDGFGALV